MSSCNSKQRLLLANLKKYKEKAKELLIECRLYKEENDLIIRGSTIMSANDGDNDYQRSDVLLDFYNKNMSCFAFKLIDHSIILFYLFTDKKGNLSKFSFSYCSCPCLIDILIDEIDDYDLKSSFLDNDETNDTTSYNDDKRKDSFLTADLKKFFSSSCGKDQKMIASIINLSKNPIYIRCDYDSSNVSEQHPEYHSTLNFISESRFKIDKEFTLFDFVVFILDIVYGKKQEHPYQYIHLSKE